MTTPMPPTDGSPAGDDTLLARLRSRFAGRFAVERELAGGGMSRVFLATETGLGRRVVVKILPPGLAAEMNRERFRREIQFAARLQHPHIVPLLAAGEEEDLLYYTMPYIEPSARGVVFGERLSVADAVEVLRDVTDALAYAHREGVIHRDIKPANVLLRDGHAVVTDFGVAKALASALVVSGDATAAVAIPATTTGLAIGTPAYMAPEQLAGDPTADHRVDIYALGLLAYELLTGKRPFNGPSPQAMLAAQLSGIPAPIIETRRDVPPVLVALIERCLEKDAHRRPATAESVLEVLKTLAVSGATRRIEAVPLKRPSTALRAIAVAAAIVALGAVAWFTAPDRRDSRSGDAVVAAVPDTPTTAAVDSLEQRILTRLRDSISAAERVRRERNARIRHVADSVRALRVEDSVSRARAAQAAQAAQAARAEQQAQATAIRTRDIINRALSRSTPPTIAQGTTSGAADSVPRPIGPEDFIFRRDNMGPARRVAVLVSTQIQNPDAMIAAGAMRDTLRAALARLPRFQLVSEEAIRASRAASTNNAAVRVAADAGGDMFLLLNTAQVGASGDSLQWTVSVADLSVHPTYRTRTEASARLALARPLEFDRGRLLREVLQHLEQLDRAPRRD